MGEIQKHLEKINRAINDIVEAVSCVFPVIDQFISEIQQFTDSVAPPVEANIDGATVDARIFLPNTEERSVKHVQGNDQKPGLSIYLH